MLRRFCGAMLVAAILAGERDGKERKAASMRMNVCVLLHVILSMRMHICMYARALCVYIPVA